MRQKTDGEYAQELRRLAGGRRIQTQKQHPSGDRLTQKHPRQLFPGKDDPEKQK